MRRFLAISQEAAALLVIWAYIIKVRDWLLLAPVGLQLPYQCPLPSCSALRGLQMPI